MPPVVRLSDSCSGHPPCFPPRPNAAGSPDVFANTLPVHRMSDAWAVHSCDSPHPGNQASASVTVFANSLGVARIGDAVSCGSTDAVGSPDVIAG